MAAEMQVACELFGLRTFGCNPLWRNDLPILRSDKTYYVTHKVIDTTRGILFRLSGKELAVCLGMSAHNAGKATDAAMKRIAQIIIDHQAEAHRMLADALDKARSERPSLEPLTEAEYYEMVAQREGRADLPGTGPKRRKQRTTTRETAQTADAEAARMRR